MTFFLYDYYRNDHHQQRHVGTKFLLFDLIDFLFFPHIQSAKSTIDICIFTLSDDHLSNLVEDARARGVRVRMLTDSGTFFFITLTFLSHLLYMLSMTCV
jgi:phosphatidylserine/phosphatidylglycerophosphate/cardiolipin synthase-like enzyme